MLSLMLEPAACFLFCSCACFSASTDRCATEPAGVAVDDSLGRAAPVDDVSGRLCVEVALGRAELGSAPCAAADDEADAPAYCARMEAAHAAEYDDAS